MKLYKKYEDLNFTSEESPIVLPVGADLTELAGRGLRSANSLVVLNTSENSFFIELCSDCDSFGDSIEIEGYEVATFNDVAIDDLRVTNSGLDSGYIIYVFADRGANISFDKNIRKQVSKSGNFQEIDSTGRALASPTFLPTGATHIRLFEEFSTLTTKINYVVPIGHRFVITRWYITTDSAVSLIVEFHIDGVMFDTVAINNDSGMFERSSYPETPFAIAESGETVAAVRIDGPAGFGWFVNIDGYLEVQ